MDAPMTASNHRFQNVIERLAARDGEGFLRAAGHAILDVFTDDLISSIRGPTTAPAALPPAGASALPEFKAPDAPIRNVGIEGVPPRITELEQENRRLTTLCQNLNADRSSMALRLEQLEAANHGLQDTLAKVSRERDAARAAVPASVPVRAKGQHPAARATVPAQVVTPPGLVDIQEAARLTGVSVRSVAYLLHHGFPRPAAKRGRANLWRRGEVEIWARHRREAKEARQPEPSEARTDREKAAALDRAIEYEDAAPSSGQASATPAAEELLVSAGVRALLGLKSTSALTGIKHSDPSFPRPVGRRGNAETYRKAEIDAWLAQRPPVTRGPKPRRLRAAAAGQATQAPAGIEEGLISTIDVADMLHVSVSGIYCRKTRDASFPKPVEKRGKTELYRKTEIEAWLAAQDKPPAAPAPEPDMIDTRGACELLSEPGQQVSAELISYHRRRNGFPAPAATVGCKYYWHRKDVEAWIEQWRARRPNPAGQGRKQAPPLRAQAKTCGTCADCKTMGRFSVCMSDSGPHRNTTRQPAGTCDWHRAKSTAPYRPVRAEDED